MKNMFAIILLICSFTSLTASDTYTDQLIAEYALPDSHPIKSFLDELSERTRWTQDATSFQKAGFRSLTHTREHHLCGYHHDFFEVIIKAHSDLGELGPEALLQRVITARTMQRFIDSHNIKHICVPEKYLYRLPENRTCSSPCVVVENRLPLASHTETKTIWEDPDFWTKEWVEELHCFFSHFADYDIWPSNHNVRFTKDRMYIALFDLESPAESGEITQRRIRTSLPSEWQAYWDKLEENKEAPTN